MVVEFRHASGSGNNEQRVFMAFDQNDSANPGRHEALLEADNATEGLCKLSSQYVSVELCRDLAKLHRFCDSFLL